MNFLNRTVTTRKLLTWLMPWLLGCALLLAQALGLMHGVVHAPQAGANGKAALASQSAFVATTQADRSGGHWVDDIFSSHHGDNDCRLFDQASHGSAAPQLAALALPVVLPPLDVTIFQGEALARWVALFDARGPPLTS